MQNPRWRFGCLAGLCLAMGGCGQSILGFGEASGSIEAESLVNGSTYAPPLTTAVYRTPDGTEADVLLTDIPIARLADRADSLSDVSGNLIHIRVFLTPEAGKTPIDRTACNATVKHVILASGVAGVYAGGGFIDPWGDPGEATYSATLKNISTRLARAAPAFADRLGPARLTGAFTASMDEKAAGAMLERLGLIDRALAVVPAKQPLIPPDPPLPKDADESDKKPGAKTAP